MREDFLGLIQGYYWHVRMSNGARFSIWTPYDLTRKEAKKKLLKSANGDYIEVYKSQDIKSIWRTRKI